LDPKFALAWALLSNLDSRGYLTLILQPTLALREEVRQAAETALTLQPNLGEAVLVKGRYYYACLKDYDTAVLISLRTLASRSVSFSVSLQIVFLRSLLGQRLQLSGGTV